MNKSIAIIGVRGIPVVYSGFETFAEELSTQLVKRGWKATVFCRKHAANSSAGYYKGVKLITLPSLNTRSLDTITHSFLSTIYACFMHPRPSIVYYLGVGSSICSWLPRLFGICTIVNVDGLDWKRGKWGRGARWFLHLSERLALYCSNQAMTDSTYVRRYYERSYNKVLPVIPYGYTQVKTDMPLLKQYGLRENHYLVWTGRLVADNHLDELLKAYKLSRIKMPLIVLGDAPHETKYKRKLQKLITKNVRFLGFVKRDVYAVIVAYSYAYIETKRSGGTHPSLVESMGHGCLIVANDHQSHREVLGETAAYYSVGNVTSLANVLQKVVQPSFLNTKLSLQKSVRERAKLYYSWSSIVKQYENLFRELTTLR